MQINVCPICQEEFQEWTPYHEHLNLSHAVTHKKTEEKKIVLQDITELMGTMNKGLERKEYQPMNPAMKRAIVARFEKKLGAAIIGLLLLGMAINARAEPPSAGWNFGTDTYEQHDSQLILNSLSDRYGISTFQTPTQSLGTNDYIEENGVKNTLALDGYTQAYDFNPNSQTGYGYSSVYNQPLPNVPLTKLTFMGLDGDPTKAQDVYVLTSEYNALSSQGQAMSINALNNGLIQTNAQVNALGIGLSNETASRIAGDAALQGQVDATNNHVATLDNRVNNLERLKVMPEADIRFYDGKHVSAMAYDAYDATNGRNFAIGVKVMLKLGRSYEEERIDELQKLVASLQNENRRRGE